MLGQGGLQEKREVVLPQGLTTSMCRGAQHSRASSDQSRQCGRTAEGGREAALLGVEGLWAGLCSHLLKNSRHGTSLVVQWLRLRAPNAGGWGLIPGQGTRSRMPQLRCGTAK